MTIKTQIATIYKDPVPHFEKSELCLEMFLRIQAPYILLHTSEDKFRANHVDNVTNTRLSFVSI